VATRRILVGVLTLCLAIPVTSLAAVAVFDPQRHEWVVAEVWYGRIGDPIVLAHVELSPGHCRARVPAVRAAEALQPCDAPEGTGVARWWSLTPVPRDYDNERACAHATQSECPQPIEYRITEIAQAAGEWTIDAGSMPALAKPGTHRVIDTTDVPGDDLIGGTRTGSITTNRRPRAFELVIRRDDAYPGILTELLGTPFVLGPRYLPEVGHQTDERLGADCVALAIYGQRRLGRPIPYVAPSALSRFSQVIAPLDSGAQPVAEGDILDFGFQTAVLFEDRPPVGLLSPSDLVIHTYHAAAEIAVLRDLPYAAGRPTVRRWLAH
jgi:hypothetical protein